VAMTQAAPELPLTLVASGEVDLSQGLAGLNLPPSPSAPQVTLASLIDGQGGDRVMNL